MSGLPTESLEKFQGVPVSDASSSKAAIGDVAGCGRRVERKPRIPVLTLIGHVILYIFWVIPLLGWGTAVMLGWLMLILIGCTIGSNTGDNKVRIGLTSVVGAVLLLVLLVNPVVGGFLLLVFAVPFLLIWLPCSNRWYREVEAMQHAIAES